MKTREMLKATASRWQNTRGTWKGNPLLNTAHPDNGGKAAFFGILGFRRDDWPTFATALRKLTDTAEVAKSVESPHAKKYVVDGRIETPRGKVTHCAQRWDC